MSRDVSSVLEQLFADPIGHRPDLQALATAGDEAIRLLAFVGALPDSESTCDELEQAVERVGEHYGLREARDQMRAWLRSKGIDLDVLPDGERDGTFELIVATQQAAYVLGLAVGLRLAGGGR